MDEQSFIIAGVLILIIFVGIAIWGVRAGQKQHKQEQHLAERKEPTFSDDAPAVAATGSAADATPATPQATLAIDYTPPELPEPDESLLLSDICFSIKFYSEDEAVAASVFTALEQKVARFALTVYRHLAFDEAQQKWQRDISKPYRYWLVAFPLADRSGRLTKERITLLEEEVRRFAQENGLHPRFSSIPEAIENAALLDKFCNEMDVVVEWRIDLAKETPVERIYEVLAMHHLSQEEQGNYVYRLDSETIFTAYCNTTLSSQHGQTLIFYLDAPKVSAPEQALTDMHNIARKVAEILNAKITDHQGAAIDSQRAATIRQQLIALRKQMTDFGVPPGSSTAHLLFS